MSRQDDSSHFALRHGQVRNIACSLLYDMVSYIIKFANVTVPNLSIFLCQLLSSYNLYYPLLKYIYISILTYSNFKSVCRSKARHCCVWTRRAGIIVKYLPSKKPSCELRQKPFARLSKITPKSISIYIFLSTVFFLWWINWYIFDSRTINIYSHYIPCC